MINAREKVKNFILFLQGQLTIYDRSGLNKRSFSKKMGISEMTLWYWLKGKNQPTLRDYYKALDILGYEETLSKIDKEKGNEK